MRQSSFLYLLVLPQFMLWYHVPFSPPHSSMLNKSLLRQV